MIYNCLSTLAGLGIGHDLEAQPFRFAAQGSMDGIMLKYERVAIGLLAAEYLDGGCCGDEEGQLMCGVSGLCSPTLETGWVTERR